MDNVEQILLKMLPGKEERFRARKNAIPILFFTCKASGKAFAAKMLPGIPSL